MLCVSLLILENKLNEHSEYFERHSNTNENDTEIQIPHKVNPFNVS